MEYFRAQWSLFPTLAELVGGDLSDQPLRLRGRSLAPLLTDKQAPRSSTFAFAQLSEYVPTLKRLANKHYEPGSRFSLQSLDFKYLWFTEGEDEFYDLRTDPYEKTNLIDSPRHLEDIERFRTTVQALVRDAVKTPVTRTTSEEELEQLQALGYTQ